jgi:hypothetical protein
VSSGLRNNAKTGQALATNYGDRASSGYNVLTPTLNKLATAPQGFDPQTMANMTTAAKQSIGGATAATVGGGLQRAAATNNAGAFGPAATQVAHDATAQLSDAALGIQNRNAMLQEEQRGEGLQGLQGLYGENVGAGENALGLSNSALNTQTAARQSGWLQNTLGVIQALNGSAGGAAALKQAYGGGA